MSQLPTPRQQHRITRITASSALLAGLVLLLTCTAATAAPRKDPVMTAINTAKVRGVVTAAEAASLRRDWTGSARALRTVRNASRRAAIERTRTYATGLARRGALTPDRVRPVLLTVRATTWVMRFGSFPRHEQTVVIPGEVVVFKYYSHAGVQYQPFETFKEGMRALNQRTPDTESAREIVDRMLQLGARRGTSLVWEYYFSFGGGRANIWTSAISQALATELVYRVAESLEGEERRTYLDAAEAIARSFVRSTAVGGVAVKEGPGRFYVMYTHHSWQRILNGHLQVLINLNRYAKATGSKLAQRVVDQGLAAVVPIMPKFDTGGWSNYQFGQEADRNYHEFQTDQLSKLADELEDPVLADYAIRFTGYLINPPEVTFPTMLYPAIFPAADRYRDSIAIPVEVDKRSKLTLIIRDAEGSEVTRTSISGGRGRHTVVWDGRRRGGTRALPGSYTGHITATDIMGNRDFVEVPAPLNVAADTIPPKLRTLVLRQRGATSVVTANAFDVGSGWITATLRIGGQVVATARGSRAGNTTIRIKRPLAQVRSGELTLTDTSGNSTAYPLAGR